MLGREVGAGGNTKNTVYPFANLGVGDEIIQELGDVVGYDQSFGVVWLFANL